MKLIDALAREVGSVGELLQQLERDRWAAATRCEPLTVKELAAHVLRQARRLHEIIEEGPVESEPEKDAATYYRYEPSSVAPGVVERARADASAWQPEQLVKEWHAQWSLAIRRSRDLIDDDPVVRSPFGLIRLSEYLRTRLVEVTVHHMDLDDAIGRELHPDPVALEGTADVLRDLLGTDLRPIGIQDLRFVLTGTGRAPLDDREREYLGPLADRFPLLS